MSKVFTKIDGSRAIIRDGRVVPIAATPGGQGCGPAADPPDAKAEAIAGAVKAGNITALLSACNDTTQKRAPPSPILWHSPEVV